tara:strand:- start:1807 stop:2193 length:387 start_codon:yes stop_codon:yes gene_type:complete
MELVENRQEYWEFIRELRNMDGVRQGFVQQEYISKDSHRNYMKKNCNFFYICLDKGTPMGYIGVIDYDIRVATHPDFQGMGVASFMLNEVMKIHPKAVAKVKIENEASLRLFEKCGFKKRYYLLEKEC